MSIRKSLATFAVAGVLALPIAPAWADCGAPGAAGAPRVEAPSSPAPDTTKQPVLEGQVAAIDRQSGQLIIETEQGFVALQASPRDVDELNVGDVITVALIDEDEPE